MFDPLSVVKTHLCSRSELISNLASDSRMWAFKLTPVFLWVGLKIYVQITWLLSCQLESIQWAVIVEYAC